MLRIGETFAGYEIKRVLGKGGMGTVYLAKHPRLPRLTALKLLARELYTDDEIRGRFEREADLVAQLDHPNIVTVYDRGAEDDQLWISMQFISGSDAASVDIDVLAPARAVQIVAEVAAALDFAHANGVLHRDIKPANILLAKAPIGQPERVLLTDFGIAGVRDSDTTLASGDTITATLAYAAPEQLGGRQLDHRADQYSLGCTLYWLLTGSAPFPNGNPAKVIHDHLYSPPPSVRATRPDLPPQLDAVLARAMAKRPEDRFDSCTEFATAAKRALAAPPTAPPRQHATYGGSPAVPGQPPHTGAAGHPVAPTASGPYPTAPAPSGPYPTAQAAGGPYPTAPGPGGPYPTAPRPGGPAPGQPGGYGPYPAVPGPATNAPYPTQGPRPASNQPYPGPDPGSSARPYGPYPTTGVPGSGGYPGRPGTGYAPTRHGAQAGPHSHPGHPQATGRPAQSSQPWPHQPAPVLPPTAPFPAGPGATGYTQAGPGAVGPAPAGPAGEGAVDLSRPHRSGPAVSGAVPSSPPPTAPPAPAQPPATASPAAGRPAPGSSSRASGRTPRPIVIALPDRVRRARPAAAGNGGASGSADGEGRPPP